METSHSIHQISPQWSGLGDQNQTITKSFNINTEFTKQTKSSASGEKSHAHFVVQVKSPELYGVLTEVHAVGHYVYVCHSKLRCAWEY